MGEGGECQEVMREEKKKLGGIKAIPFVLANEVCDRFAMIGFNANMITYLTQQLNMPLVEASNTLTNFQGTSSLTPLIGALIADSFAGRYWTICIGSLIYELGMISLTISAVVRKLRPPPCGTQDHCQQASPWQLCIVYMSFLLTSIGAGGIRPCVSPFLADQFDMSKLGQASRKWNLFNLYFFVMGLATLMAVTIAVYIQDDVGWGWGLTVPTIAMALSIVIFVAGSPLFKKLKPGGSPLVRLSQVSIAAFRKRNAAIPSDPNLLYENGQLDAGISSDGRLLHTNQLKFFDKAAIITEVDNPTLDKPNLWRLSTVHRVEELKSIIRLIPIWSAGIVLTAASCHQYTFSIQQGNTMDRHLSHSFKIPSATMNIFNIIVMLIAIVVYERLFVPFMRRFTGKSAGISNLQRMGIGLIIGTFSTIAAALVESKRKAVAAKHNLLDKPHAVIPISVFWLIPQYGLHGLAEVFIAIGQLEFFYDQAPESMRSTATALYWIAISLGNYVSTLLVSLVHKYSGKDNNWLPNRNLNRGRLDYYYWLVSCLQALNFIYYIVCTRYYSYKPLEEVEAQSPSKFVSEINGRGDVELAWNDRPSNPPKDNGEGSQELARNAGVQMCE
ncbi:hypothetical protein NE237_009635 [Protea cynaroides]|uniref:Uncharacterized protein n=1 Tax=Protea cynaroides TaxID=273540 RepID=A0A9Q0R0X9_9MAGN|nr:hypothetical protein NE237_009635 [Protea cynaroides]